MKIGKMKNNLAKIRSTIERIRWGFLLYERERNEIGKSKN